MTNLRRATRLTLLCLLWAATAGAQSTPTSTQAAASESSDTALRYSTTTADGDTGL
jgi:hypothetical protein